MNMAWRLPIATALIMLVVGCAIVAKEEIATEPDPWVDVGRRSYVQEIEIGGRACVLAKTSYQAGGVSIWCEPTTP